MKQEPIFGRVITAMVTPFDTDGAVDLARAEELAARLVDEQDNDAIVVNGTTGEAPTTTDAEKRELVRVVRQAVDGRAQVIAGVGTNCTEHTITLAREAEQAGAEGLLVVTPYYSRPPQDAVAAHFEAVADSTGLPVVIYDIPHRTGTPVETPTLLRLAEHPLIVAVKDAKGDPVSSSLVMANSKLTYYAGDDSMALPLMAVGAAGVVGTSTHFTGRRTKQMVEAFAKGKVDEALAWHRELLGVYRGVFATQGVMLVKAGLAHQGFPVGGVRRPLLDATPEQAATFAALLDACDL